MVTGTFATKYGPWAVVTGGARGIGLGFVRALRARGLSVLTIDRNDGSAVAEACGASFARIDLAQPAAGAAVEAAVGDREVGLFVGNAAIARPGRFFDHAIDEELAMLDANCRGALLALHAVGQRIVARGRGGIVLVASTAARNGGPYLAGYAASKAWTLSLADSIAVECPGIDVQALLPGMTDTEGLRASLGSAKPALLPMAVDDVVRASLDGLGRCHEVVPGFRNKLSTALTRFVLPRSLRHRLYVRQSLRPFVP